MKKLLTVSLASTVLLTIPFTAHAERYHGMNINIKSQNNQSTKKVDLPVLNDKKTADALKNGNFSYKGITLHSSYSQITKALGQADEEMINKLDLGSMNTMTYGKKDELNIITLSHMRNAADDDHIVEGIDFNYEGKKVKLSDIKSIIGKPKSKDLSDFANKNKYDDELEYIYKNYRISFERPKGIWIVKNLDYSKDTGLTLVPDVKEGKLKNKEIKPLKSSELKAMRQGTFKYFDVKPGMTHQQVVNTIGDSNEEDIYRIKDIQMLTSQYGQTAPLEFNYKVMKRGADIMQAQLHMLTFDYWENDLQLKTIEKSLGKYTTSKSGSFKEQNNDKISKTATLTRTYGKHVEVYAEKEKSRWMVKSVIYK